jgi:hypothetical protein
VRDHGEGWRGKRGDNFPKISYPRSKNLTDNVRALLTEGRQPVTFG